MGEVSFAMKYGKYIVLLAVFIFVMMSLLSGNIGVILMAIGSFIILAGLSFYKFLKPMGVVISLLVGIAIVIVGAFIG